MDHVLDNPAWNALVSGNNNLSNGNEAARYFDEEVSPFVGLKENSPDNFQLLHNLLPHESPVGFISPVQMQIPGPWKVLKCIRCFQMIYDDAVIPAAAEIALLPLQESHVPQMLTLTKLTNPGPFAPKTIEFEHYQGIFDGDQLIAMAGQRLHVFNYAEISAVCTHPGYLGRGYARQLLLHHISRIKAAAEIPFLHVRNDNHRAIKVYESLGFTIRKEIYFYFLQKNKA